MIEGFFGELVLSLISVSLPTVSVSLPTVMRDKAGLSDYCCADQCAQYLTSDNVVSGYTSRAAIDLGSFPFFLSLEMRYFKTLCKNCIET